MKVRHGHKFWKVPFTVTLYGKYTRVLTFFLFFNFSTVDTTKMNKDEIRDAMTQVIVPM